MAIATPTEYGGYEYTFVEPPPNRCICNICHYPSRDPYMTGRCCRGQTICKSCLDNWLVTSGANRCPVCSKEIARGSNTHPNYHIEREVSGLHIYCTNKEKGCAWQGELNNINNHLGNSDGCQFEVVKCSNECRKMIERRYLTSHVETECPRRKVNCQYCHDTVEHQFIEGQHKEECPKLLLPICPNKCGIKNVFHEDMEAHRKKCPLEMIQCEYHNVGCEVRMARKDQEKHENDEMKEHLKKTNNQLVSALQRVEVLLYLATNEAVTRPTSTAIVLESSAGWSDKLVAMVIMAKSGDQNCPVILKMLQYNNKKDNNVSWYSDSFYTHNQGYKMCLCVDAAGHGDAKGTYLSVFLYLMKGPPDDELTWPLRGKFEIKLLNQISDSEHHSKTVNYHYTDDEDIVCRVTKGDRATGGWGHHIFISNEDLHKTTPTCQYLKDDCLFFQVGIINKNSSYEK